MTSKELYEKVLKACVDASKQLPEWIDLLLIPNQYRVVVSCYSKSHPTEWYTIIYSDYSDCEISELITVLFDNVKMFYTRTPND